MNLRTRAINEARKLLKQGLDDQRVIQILFNSDSDEYDRLFENMDDDERFQEAEDILTEANPYCVNG